MLFVFGIAMLQFFLDFLLQDAGSFTTLRYHTAAATCLHVQFPVLESAFIMRELVVYCVCTCCLCFCVWSLCLSLLYAVLWCVEVHGGCRPRSRKVLEREQICGLLHAAYLHTSCWLMNEGIVCPLLLHAVPSPPSHLSLLLLMRQESARRE